MSACHRLGRKKALQTFGHDLKYNVHVHPSITCGGLTDDKKTWKEIPFSKQVSMLMWHCEIINLLRLRHERLALGNHVCHGWENMNHSVLLHGPLSSRLSSLLLSIENKG
ncbi:transposase [Endozoicomonas sp. ISHI1]|uniref:transposase n=1 Tax=Endozoicomonas sp. ISHI1 TaxID=2825882 RepID=UPI00359FF1D3